MRVLIDLVLLSTGLVTVLLGAMRDELVMVIVGAVLISIVGGANWYRAVRR